MYHHSKLQPIPSTSSKSSSRLISRPHKAYLSVKYIFYDRCEDFMATPPFSKSLQAWRKRRIPSGIKSLTGGSGQNDSSLIRGDLRKLFLNSLKEFRNLESLKITCVSFSDLRVLRRAFNGFRGLKRLEITFAGMTSVHDRKCPRDFIKALSPRLNQLKLAFADSLFDHQRKDSRSHLRNCRVDRLNNLQKLALHFPISTLLQEKKGNPDSAVRYIDLSPMKRLNRLKSLEIALIHRLREERVQVDIKHLHFDPNKLFPNLKTLTWSVFSSSALKIKELELIGPQIASRLKYLDDFGLGFKHNRAKVEIRELSKCLVALKTYLNSLCFVYNCGELSKQDTKALLSELSFKRLKKLHTLSLKFNQCQGITNGFLIDLAQVCSENFLGLRFLRLYFESFEEENKIRSFMKAMFGIERISDRGIKSFGEILSKNCLYLEFVSLDFEKYWEISDKGVKGLCERLHRLNKLKTVWIRFRDCWNVTEMGCREAAKLLGTHRQVSISGWRRP